MSDPDWFERQRSFQARTLVDPGTDVELRAYRTFAGPVDPPHHAPVGRMERVFFVVGLAAVVVGVVLLLGGPRVIAALVAGLAGGAALILGLAGGEPEPMVGSRRALVAVYPAAVTVNDRPVCVAAIGDDDRRRLRTEGTGSVVGTLAPNGCFGLFIDDHLVWPQSRPRAAMPSDPTFGT